MRAGLAWTPTPCAPLKKLAESSPPKQQQAKCKRETKKLNQAAQPKSLKILPSFTSQESPVQSNHGLCIWAGDEEGDAGTGLPGPIPAG